MPDNDIRKQKKNLVEALLFVAWEPVSVKRLAEVAECDTKLVRELLQEIRADFADRGFQLTEIAGGWQFLTGEELAPYIEKLYNPRTQQLSKAALETLAIVAYRQPVTRLEIDNIRQVKSDAVLAKLMEKSLVKEVGRQEGPGRPILYGTTREFLSAFGMVNLADLPPLPEAPEQTEVNLFSVGEPAQEARPEDINPD